MDKKTMILLIEAYDAIRELNVYLSVFGGSGLNGSPFDRIFNVYIVLWKNSKYYTGDDNEGYEECLAVLNNHELSAEERYDQLME